MQSRGYVLSDEVELRVVGNGLILRFDGQAHE